MQGKRKIISRVESQTRENSRELPAPIIHNKCYMPAMSYANLAVLDFPEWSPIARCVRGKGGFNNWMSLEDAPMSVEDAHGLERTGQIFMAQKKINDTWFVVVKSRRTPRPYVEAREPLGAGAAKRTYRKKWHAL